MQCKYIELKSDQILNDKQHQVSLAGRVGGQEREDLLTVEGGGPEEAAKGAAGGGGEVCGGAG